MIHQHLTPETVDAIQDLMIEASAAIMKIYQSPDLGVEYKEDTSPLTKADKAAHDILCRGLKRLTPSIPILSEESEKGLSGPEKGGIFWLIDPLDGTKSFINRTDDFTVNVALIENHYPIYGFVTIPAQGLLYCGGHDKGAHRSGYEMKNNTPVAAATHPLNTTNPHSPLRVVASKNHLNEATQKFIDQVPGEKEFLQFGSSLKFLKIAEGEADLYPRLAPTCEWDTAAAQAILEGAGGSVNNLEGQRLQYGKADILNPHFVARGR